MTWYVLSKKSMAVSRYYNPKTILAVFDLRDTKQDGKWNNIKTKEMVSLRKTYSKTTISFDELF